MPRLPGLLMLPRPAVLQRLLRRSAHRPLAYQQAATHRQQTLRTRQADTPTIGLPATRQLHRHLRSCRRLLRRARIDPLYRTKMQTLHADHHLACCVQQTAVAHRHLRRRRSKLHMSQALLRPALPQPSSTLRTHPYPIERKRHQGPLRVASDTQIHRLEHRVQQRRRYQVRAPQRPQLTQPQRRQTRPPVRRNTTATQQTERIAIRKAAGRQGLVHARSPNLSRALRSSRLRRTRQRSPVG